jgi:16S rRNA (uracil1498-N3)-methyltransferase
MNLVLLEPDELDADGTATLTGGRAIHLLKVLRVDPGSTVRVGVVDGPSGVGEVVSTVDGKVTLQCRLEQPAAERPEVDLLLALPRPKVLKRLWAQLAALGVGRILLTNAARVERDYFATHVIEPSTWRPLLLEGLQQARDTRLPEVTVHRRFRLLVEDELDELVGDADRVVAHPAGDDGVARVVSGFSRRRVLLAVGPEGGWTPFELALLERHRFVAAAMGPRTLRTDTACIALLSLAHDALRTRQAGTGSRL